MKFSRKIWLRRAAEQDTWTRSKRGCRRTSRLIQKLTERGSQNSGSRRRDKGDKEMAIHYMRTLPRMIRTSQQVESDLLQPVAVIQIRANLRGSQTEIKNLKVATSRPMTKSTSQLPKGRESITRRLQESNRRRPPSREP